MIVDEKSTSDVLKQYQELGFDLTKSMIIEFFIEGSQKNLQSIASPHFSEFILLNTDLKILPIRNDLTFY